MLLLNLYSRPLALPEQPLDRSARRITSLRLKRLIVALRLKRKIKREILKQVQDEGIRNSWIPVPHLCGDRLRVNDGPPSGGDNPLQPDRVTKYN